MAEISSILTIASILLADTVRYMTSHVTRRAVLGKALAVPLLGIGASRYLQQCAPQAPPAPHPGWNGATVGWHELRARQTLNIGPFPVANSNDVIGPWNKMAGWPMLQVAGPGERIWCEEMSPINSPEGRRQAWVQRFLNPDTSMNQVVIHYDPWYPNLWPWVEMMRHELGHALGFGGDSDCDNPYRGVMSYCGFPRPLNESDQQMLRVAGYA
jgi:hypothetical protein